MCGRGEVFFRQAQHRGPRRSGALMGDSHRPRSETLRSAHLKCRPYASHFTFGRFFGKVIFFIRAMRAGDGRRPKDTEAGLRLLGRLVDSRGDAAAGRTCVAAPRPWRRWLAGATHIQPGVVCAVCGVAGPSPSGKRSGRSNEHRLVAVRCCCALAFTSCRGGRCRKLFALFFYYTTSLKATSRRSACPLQPAELAIIFFIVYMCVTSCFRTLDSAASASAPPRQLFTFGCASRSITASYLCSGAAALASRRRPCRAAGRCLAMASMAHLHPRGLGHRTGAPAAVLLLPSAICEGWPPVACCSWYSRHPSPLPS